MFTSESVQSAETQTTVESVSSTTAPDSMQGVDASCAAGSYSPPGYNACIQCETGTFASAAMATVCTQCAAGRYNEMNGATQCGQCPAGKFSFFTGSSVCSSCPAWTGSAAGMSSCVTCSSSGGCRYADASVCPTCSGACTLCSAGFYNDGGSNRCVACGSGKYLSGLGGSSSAACIGCFSGTYTRPMQSGMSSCLQCSLNSAMSLPQNAVYLTSDVHPLLCKWVCAAGFQTMLASPLQGSDEWGALSSSYANQGFSDGDITLMIKYRSDYCCDASSVMAGQWRTGCTKTNQGTIAECPPIANGQFYYAANTDSLNRCDDWVCNAGFYRRNGLCIAQPVCGAGFTYARDGSGQLVAQSDVYSCVACPVCMDGTETATACTRTHSAVCRMCGGGRQYSVGGGACVKDPPIGFRGVKATFSSSPAWGVRPVLTFDNKTFVWASSTVFYSFVACVDAGAGRVFTGGDAVCNIATDNYCNQCTTQCSPWRRSGGWFQGSGWYGGVSCTACQFDPLQCTASQFLDMSVCGPVQQPQCSSCPGSMPVDHQVGWVNPRDVAFSGQYPCRVVCAAGYSEVNDQCVMCSNLPANVILVNGCEWRCKPGYLQNNNQQCEACPVLEDCATGFYPDYQGSFNVCLSCMACQKPSNSVFTTGGTFGVATSCAYACEAAFYRSGNLCAACTQQRSCVGGFLTPCTETSDSQCTTCRVCSVGERQVSACTQSNNTVCAGCDPSLKPDNSTWTAVGCGTWACVNGFWRDGSVCRRCSAQKDCGVGSTLQLMPSVCSASTGKCVACPALLAGECYNGDPYCGTIKGCVPVSTRTSGFITPVLTSRFPPPRTTTPIMPLTTIMRLSTLVVTPPITATEPEAFASLAALTINPNVTINAELFDGLARNVSMLVCADAKGFCNVSVLAVTVNNVTTFCNNGVCPGYARSRRLLGVTVVVVSIGIVTQVQIVDVSAGLDSIVAVDSSSVMPNSPVANLTSILGDAMKIMQQVQAGYTVYVISEPKIVVVDNTTTIVIVACCVVVVILAMAVVRRNQQYTPLVPPGNEKGARLTALDSIRITKENYKPFVKTS